jgi:site-specific DNA recombinase
MKAIGYIRVSTEEQAAEGISLDAQRGKLKAWADLHGHELLTVYSDDGISGKRADNRPGLQAALAAVCQCKGILVVWDLSRLARSTRDALDIVDRLQKCGAQLAIITLNADTTTAHGSFIFTLFAALATLERQQIAERTKIALAHKRSKGEKLGGQVPVGFTVVRDGARPRLQPDEAEQRTVAAILGMRQQGMGYKAIADELNRQGVVPKRGRQWYAKVVRSVCLRVGQFDERVHA